jgi:hypothetical protein
VLDTADIVREAMLRQLRGRVGLEQGQLFP